MRAEEDKTMASDDRLRGLAERWLGSAALRKRLLHGEVESLVAMLLEVREEALERGRETLHKAIQDRADMQAKLANTTSNWATIKNHVSVIANAGARNNERQAVFVELRDMMARLEAAWK